MTNEEMEKIYNNLVKEHSKECEQRRGCCCESRDFENKCTFFDWCISDCVSQSKSDLFVAGFKEGMKVKK